MTWLIEGAAIVAIASIILYIVITFCNCFGGDNK